MSTIANVPVHGLDFEFIQGDSSYLKVADLESLSISIESGVEEWKPLDMEGWSKRMLTAKSITLSFAGKRNFNDQGNNYVAGFALKSGPECEVSIRIVFPSGGKLVVNGIIDVKTIGGGDSTALCPLEFDILSSGKPEYTQA